MWEEVCRWTALRSDGEPRPAHREGRESDSEKTLYAVLQSGVIRVPWRDQDDGVASVGRGVSLDCSGER